MADENPSKFQQEKAISEAAMAQAAELNSIDMERGSTNFLDPYWDDIEDTAPLMDQAVHERGYQDDASENLKKEIIDLHDHVQNTNTIDRHVVVGNGIRQVMLAAIHAHAKQTGLKIVYADPPHFFMFKDMVESIGLEFCDDSDQFDPETMINLITSPSNPIGVKGPQNVANVNIWDMCYNWPQYDDVGFFLNNDVQIFGLSKATGHASTRIGWALVQDGMTAYLMREFIKLTTGGVSVEAQYRAEQELAVQNMLLRNHPGKDVFSYGRKALDDRWNRIHWLGLMLPEHKSGIEILNCVGMFAWCQLHDPQLDVPGTKMTAAMLMLEKYNIKAMDGSLCHPDGRNMFRLNLGCDQETFNRFDKLMVSLEPDSAAARQAVYNESAE